MVICSILEGSYLLKALADHCNSIIHIHCMLYNIINNKIPISSFLRWTRCRDIQPRNHSLVASFLLMCSCIIIVNRGGLVGDMSRSIYHTVFMVKCGKYAVSSIRYFSCGQCWWQFQPVVIQPAHTNTQAPASHVHERLSQTRWHMSPKLDVNADICTTSANYAHSLHKRNAESMNSN